MLAAITSIHKARGIDENEGYCDPCDQCIALDKDGDRFGCNECRGRGFPKLWRRGNPCRNVIVTNTARQSTLDAAGYQALGDSPLTPQELLLIRQNLMSKGLSGFQQYTETIVESFLFARDDEGSDLKAKKIDFGGKYVYNCINWDITVFNENGEMEGLGITLFGKSDKVPMNLLEEPF
ncbi:UNVERIFIED_CONTAM: hypothetical protein HDU68_010818 [Siphonaria sp. JEL0065]|nr:hypothetical protein HDU68_010818 [Siphonaria sp. JEL0065]